MVGQKHWILACVLAGAAVLIQVHLHGRSTQAAPAAQCAFSIAKQGSLVHVRYELRNGNDGTVIDSSGEAEFAVGESEEHAHLNAVVQGMSVGQTRETLIGNDAQFGEWREDWIASYDRDQFPAELKLGMTIQVQDSNARVFAFNETVVTLDFNHPLAGQNATLVATLISCEALREDVSVIVEAISFGDNTTFPKPGDRVSVHCVATFADNGDSIYSSRERGAPYEFQLGASEVIEGLEIGIQNVSLGGSARTKIPANLAYGRQSASVAMPANRDVIYEVELLSIG